MQRTETTPHDCIQPALMSGLAAGADDAPAGSFLPPSGPCVECSAPASTPLSSQSQGAPAPAPAAPGQDLQPATVAHALREPAVGQPTRRSSSGESGGTGSSSSSGGSGGSRSSGEPGPAPAAALSSAAQLLALPRSAPPPHQPLPERLAARRSSSSDSLNSTGSSSTGSSGGSARSASGEGSAAVHSAADEGEGGEYGDSDSEDGVRLGRREALQGVYVGAQSPERSSPLSGAGSPSGAAAVRRACSGPLPQAGTSFWAPAAQHTPGGSAEAQAEPVAAATPHAAALAGSSGAPRRPVRRSLFPEDARARASPGSAAAGATGFRAPGIDWGARGDAPGEEQGGLAGTSSSQGGDHRGAVGGVWALAAHRGQNSSGDPGHMPTSPFSVPPALSPPGGFKLAWQLRPRGSDPETLRAGAAEAQGAAGARGTDPSSCTGLDPGQGLGSSVPALDVRSSMALQPESSVLVSAGSAPTNASFLVHSPPGYSSLPGAKAQRFPGPYSSAISCAGRMARCSCSAGEGGGSYRRARCARGGRPQPRPLARRQAAHAQAAAGATALRHRPPMPEHKSYASGVRAWQAPPHQSLAGTRR